MNNQYSDGYDLDMFKTQLLGTGASASLVPNPQQRNYEPGIGPEMADYDPAMILGGSSSYSSRTGNISGTVSTLHHASSANNNNTHQTLMPSSLGTTAGVAMPLHLQQQQHQHIGMNSVSNHCTTCPNDTSAYADKNFDPISMRQQQPHHPHQVVNQHLHQHQHVHHHHHHHNSRPRTHRNSNSSLRSSTSCSSTMNSRNESSNSYPSNIFATPQHVPSLPQHEQLQLEQHQQNVAKQVISRENPPPILEPWMETLSITVSGVSLEPFNGYQVIAKLQERTGEVFSRYLPCVHFLVQCQQELRKGLAAATTKRLMHHMVRDAMTPRQFYATYIQNLPKRFYQENRGIMSTENLMNAFKGLQKLCADAKAAESQGCEVVKNTFLGGMKDGESWGLRKWLSKQGGALLICNDTELLLSSCQKLDRALDTTIKLAERLRPLAKEALNKLKCDVPSSYQEQSSAHPYLPFFHRLESALRGMSNFDPEDDDVICLDDDDVKVAEIKSKPSKVESAPPQPSKRKTGDSKASSNKPQLKRKATEIFEAAVTVLEMNGGDNCIDRGIFDGDSDIEILDAKPSAQKRIKASSPVGGADALLAAMTGDDTDYMKALLSTFDEDVIDDFGGLDKRSSLDNVFPIEKDAYDLATGIDQLARLFDSDHSKHKVIRPDFVVADPFWDQGPTYARVLRIFSDILREPSTSSNFLNPVAHDMRVQDGKPSYDSIIKHPLCFRDIVTALLEDFSSVDNTITGNNGVLPDPSLSSWNMWNGKELLQAIDLVFLNFLAYEKSTDGGGKSTTRSLANKLRKKLWAHIKQIVDERIGTEDLEERKKCTPTRRGESSSFVVSKAAKSA